MSGTRTIGVHHHGHECGAEGCGAQGTHYTYIDAPGAIGVRTCRDHVQLAKETAKEIEERGGLL